MNDFSLSPTEASQPTSTRSGLTLVLPPLKSGKLAKGQSKTKSRKDDKVPVDIKQGPRPVKLKPLREVLSKLIAQIQKKDDYAFFLKPVDPSQVPGYSDAIQRPMDLGTMSNKVRYGRYRSLEEFTDDLRLVTTNAKTFNPPGTLYHSEAERIEAWALEHIAKAASIVIAYETDWNIDIEQDDNHSLNAYDASMPMDVDGDDFSGKGRSPSVQAQERGRRGLRGPYNKKPQVNNTVGEIDTAGRLPGSKDGVGAFPPGSDWAEMMVLLKLKGKRYKTKKERLRIEKGGPPYCADGSLDYSEMEDPFSILSVLVPEQRTRPQLTPLYQTTTYSQYQYQHKQYPAPVNVSLKRPIDHLYTSPVTRAPKRRRHWTLLRNAPTRIRAKDEGESIGPTLVKETREPLPIDWGLYPLLGGELPYGQSQDGVLDALRASLDPHVGMEGDEEEYWNTWRAREGEKFIRDVVYGGIDGLAYLRSVAEFVSATPVERGEPALGMPLVEYVQQHFINPLTENFQEVLHQTSIVLLSDPPSRPIIPAIAEQVDRSLNSYPQLSELLRISKSQIDMASLIRRPDEIYQSEGEWVGKECVPAADSGEHAGGMHGEGEANVAVGLDGKVAFDSPEVLEYVLDYTARTIAQLDQKIRERDEEKDFKMEDGAEVDEDPLVRKLRLNLLALAKRAPLDKIARLPKELVPVHIRHFVPTMP